MSYKYSVMQLKQFAADKLINSRELWRLLEVHYPAYYADKQKLRAELKADAEAAKQALRPNNRPKVTAFVISTALLHACFPGGPTDVTGETTLEDLRLGEYGEDRLFHAIKSRYDIDFDEEFETVADVVDLILELM